MDPFPSVIQIGMRATADWYFAKSGGQRGRLEGIQVNQFLIIRKEIFL